MLYNLQGVGHVTKLDISHNYITDLGSDIFTDLPQLIHLDLSHNSLSTLDITVTTQLVKMSSSADLNCNPWVCDCLMFNIIYSCVVTTAWTWNWCVQALRNLKINYGKIMNIQAVVMIARTLKK